MSRSVMTTTNDMRMVGPCSLHRGSGRMAWRPSDCRRRDGGPRPLYRNDYCPRSAQSPLVRPPCAPAWRGRTDVTGDRSPARRRLRLDGSRTKRIQKAALRRVMQGGSRCEWWTHSCSRRLGALSNRFFMRADEAEVLTLFNPKRRAAQPSTPGNPEGGVPQKPHWWAEAERLNWWMLA
jgi:hypothetical protein